MSSHRNRTEPRPIRQFTAINHMDLKARISRTTEEIAEIKKAIEEILRRDLDWTGEILTKNCMNCS